MQIKVASVAERWGHTNRGTKLLIINSSMFSWHCKCVKKGPFFQVIFHGSPYTSKWCLAYKVKIHFWGAQTLWWAVQNNPEVWKKDPFSKQTLILSNFWSLISFDLILKKMTWLYLFYRSIITMQSWTSKAPFVAF